MARALLILAALVVGCAAQGGPFNFTCNTDKFTQCLSTFTTNLSLTTPTPYKNSRVFRAEIENYYAKGSTNGFLTLCRAFRQFKECLNFDYPECMSVSHLVLSGLSTVQQAYDFVSVFNQQHFACGAGLGVYLQNENCLAGTWQDHRQHFNTCYERYFAQIDAGGNGAPCVAGREFSECFEYEFGHSCSTTRADVMWWGCEYGRTFSATQYPQCTYKCTTMNVGGGI
uniref:Salivary secreted protein n=1 Tax=Panagrellus redivivus TaxID=6233 RepID=A0A7E4WBI6_PANRE